jgi:hypothetical protein
MLTGIPVRKIQGGYNGRPVSIRLPYPLLTNADIEYLRCLDPLLFREMADKSLCS